MITTYDGGVYLVDGSRLMADGPEAQAELAGRTPGMSREDARKGTISWSILQAHNTAGEEAVLKLTFDALTSHDITCVNVVQTVKSCGMEKFPMPYVLTNCHNALCAVGGTLNGDDHIFGLSAAQKYGGVYVPPHLAVIHSYMREMYAGCGRMILGSDSHTRYGALGTMAIGEGGGELVKQLVGKTYDLPYPEVVCVYLTGKPQPGVGPQDVALAIIGATFQRGTVKNKVMEFVGDGIQGLSADFRNGIDVMTTEATCLSSIWMTDETTAAYYEVHGRPEAYHLLAPKEAAYYDGALEVDLSRIQPMIALPFHPSNVYSIQAFCANAADILRGVEQEAAALAGRRDAPLALVEKLVDGKLVVDQGVIAGCAGGLFENITDAAGIIGDASLGNGKFSLSIYPASQPVMLELSRQGILTRLMQAGATVHTAFCGPCFGAGDVPANRQLSIRHTTRNFPHREGSKPGQGQMAAVALMDARSIAATARNGGVLTAATDTPSSTARPLYHFDRRVYDNRIYDGYGHPKAKTPLQYGPNIVDWPEIGPMRENLLLGMAAVICDPVTTTDELIPSGDTATYRSNPIGLAEFTLSRKDPGYVGRAKEYLRAEKARLAGEEDSPELAAIAPVLAAIHHIRGYEQVGLEDVGLGSLIYAVKPGDGSAREQAASCQRVLGGCANIAKEYATKRYRSNLINWGILPLRMANTSDFSVGDYIFLPGIRSAVLEGKSKIEGYMISGDLIVVLNLTLDEMTDEEKRILVSGCLINDYRQ